MSKVQLLGEDLAYRMAIRFSIPGMLWSFDELIDKTPSDQVKGLDMELLELYTLVLMPVALVELTSGKYI